jgi:hypothetical protein
MHPPELDAGDQEIRTSSLNDAESRAAPLPIEQPQPTASGKTCTTMCSYLTGVSGVSTICIDRSQDLPIFLADFQVGYRR